jgi:hypothetical protein
MELCNDSPARESTNEERECYLAIGFHGFLFLVGKLDTSAKFLLLRSRGRPLVVANSLAFKYVVEPIERRRHEAVEADEIN